MYTLTDGTPVPLHIYNRCMFLITDRDHLEDKWESVSKEWDLHLTSDENDWPVAILYPVDEHGDTRTATWLRLL
jgi:hypothetical protein